MAEEPPRWLDRDALAVHISVRVDEVRKLLRAGKLPTPSYHLGPRSPRWDRLAVDACFAGEAASADPEVAVQGVVQKILEGGYVRPRR
jgi:hypothetical protein